MWKKRLLIGITIFTTILSSLSVSASTPIEYTDVQSDEANLDNHEKEQISMEEEQSLPIPDENSSLEDGESEDVFTYGQINDSKEQELTDQTADTWNMARGGGTWVNEGGRWWYRHYDGSYTKNGWEEIDGLWYHFDVSGWMEADKWILDGGKWYYVDSSGVMAVEKWMQLGGKWYYFDGHGAMQIGWQIIGGKWYFFNDNGSMQTGTKLMGGRTFYFDATGAWLYTISLQGWNLVDSGKHLDWENKSKYGSYIPKAVKKWNDYKSGVIREHSWVNIKDVTIKDISVSNTDVIGETSHSGAAINLNTQKMDRITDAERLSTVIHEFGHALGLNHNSEEDIMYEKNIGNTELSRSDKESYAEAYRNY